MKVLHLSKDDIGGGAGMAAFRLHQGLKRSGVESVMLVMRKCSDDPDVIEIPKDARFYLTKIGGRVEDLLVAACCDSGQQWDVGVVPGFIRNRMQKIAPDIVNLHLVNRGVISIGEIGRLSVPTVWTFHDMWAITAGYHYYGSALKEDLVPPDGGFDPDSTSNMLSRWLLKKKCKAWKEQAVQIVCPSRWLQQVTRQSPVMAGKNVQCIPYGLDLEVFRPSEKSFVRESLGLPVDKKLILFGAASSDDDPRKGSDLLLEAIQAGIEDSLIDADTTELVSFGHQAKLPGALQQMNVHSMGRVSGDDTLARIFSSADVFVAPSREDNLPNTVLEAMACGVPTVAFRIGGMPDMIDHLSTGYLADPFDTGDLARGIACALADVSSADVRGRAEQYYALDRQAADYVGLYEKMLGEAAKE